MAPRRITFVSPIEPSGASWLVNCLLELGVRVNHIAGETRLWRGSEPQNGMWLRDGDSWIIHPRAEVLGKWLPALMTTQRFAFRDDVVVDYVQAFPTGPTDDALLFLRDPRDAIYSLYRRRRAGMPFADYCQMPNVQTLLPAADHWAFYVQCWQAQAGAHVYRFEDYKHDDVALLTRIVGDFDLGFAAQAIGRAAAASTSDKAKIGEALYRERHPGDWEVANRAGKVGDWQGRGEVADAVAKIGVTCAPVLSALGYDVEAGSDVAKPSFDARRACLPVFASAAVPDALAPLSSVDPADDPDLPGLLQFAATVDAPYLSRSGLSPADTRCLLDSLIVLTGRFQPDSAARLQELKAGFSDGSAQHMQVLRDLMRRSRKARG